MTTNKPTVPKALLHVPKAILQHRTAATEIVAAELGHEPAAVKGGGQLAICVMGMARSGTTMMMLCLYRAGISVGNTDHLAGCIENGTMAEFNQKLGRMFGLTRNADVPDLPPGWLDRPEVVEMIKEASEYVKRAFPSDRPWAWKHGQNSWTLPFWRRAIDIPVKAVTCFRNPLECVDSLDRFSPHLGRDTSLSMWGQYIAAALKHDACVVHYTNMIENAGRQFKRLMSYLGLVSNGRKEFCATPTAKNRHHRHTLDELMASGVPQAVKDTYMRALERADD